MIRSTCCSTKKKWLIVSGSCKSAHVKTATDSQLGSHLTVHTRIISYQSEGTDKDEKKKKKRKAFVSLFEFVEKYLEVLWSSEHIWPWHGYPASLMTTEVEFDTPSRTGPHKRIQAPLNTTRTLHSAVWLCWETSTAGLSVRLMKQEHLRHMEQKWTRLSPRGISDFYHHATPAHDSSAHCLSSKHSTHFYSNDEVNSYKRRPVLLIFLLTTRIKVNLIKYSFNIKTIGGEKRITSIMDVLGKGQGLKYQPTPLEKYSYLPFISYIQTSFLHQ